MTPQCHVMIQIKMNMIFLDLILLFRPGEICYRKTVFWHLLG